MSGIWRRGKRTLLRSYQCLEGKRVGLLQNHLRERIYRYRNFLTDNGWKRANELKDSDKPLDEDGNSAGISRVDKTDETLDVVNLQFASPTIIIANGVQSGDFAIQNGKMPE